MKCSLTPQSVVNAGLYDAIRGNVQWGMEKRRKTTELMGCERILGAMSTCKALAKV